MKKIFYIILVTLLISCAETNIQNKDAVIEFKEHEFNFKQLSFKEDAAYFFEFSNPGNSPLIIQNVNTTCGCTVPEWPKNPINPSETGEIKIKYDTSHPGSFSKTIKVFYNGKDSPVQLTIKGSVNYPKDL